MGFFDSDSSQGAAYEQYQGTEEHHEASFSHELLAGAASFAAARAYENHVAENGQPPNHAVAKELFAGFAGAFIDREVETKGLDFVDRERAKRHAEEHFDGVNQSELGY